MSWSGTQPTGGRQRLLNESWPPQSATIRNADEPIPVTARLVWADDGEEWVESRAMRWRGRHVFVALHDRRNGYVQGVWIDASDVRRR